MAIIYFRRANIHFQARKIGFVIYSNSGAEGRGSGVLVRGTVKVLRIGLQNAIKYEFGLLLVNLAMAFGDRKRVTTSPLATNRKVYNMSCGVAANQMGITMASRARARALGKTRRNNETGN